METFLLTYQSFTTANELLHKLIERYYISWNHSKSWKDFEYNRNISQLRVCNLFLTWTKKYTSDFLWKSAEEIESEKRPNTVAAVIGQRGFVAELLLFVETILAQDHPLMARQIRRNIVRLVRSRQIIPK